LVQPELSRSRVSEACVRVTLILLRRALPSGLVMCLETRCKAAGRAKGFSAAGKLGYNTSPHHIHGHMATAGADRVRNVVRMIHSLSMGLVLPSG
jgi:hypothetical protein